MKVKVQTLQDSGSAGKGGDIELDDEIFAVEPRADILHRVVTWQLINRRAPARAARERSDVARTGKKFGRQKGGGTARHGDRRAPIFVGGGKAHGPRARVFTSSLNKKVRQLGLKMALSSKAKEGNLIVVDNLDVSEAKTKSLKAQLGKLGFGKTALVIDGDALNVGFARASSNLESVNLLPAVGANVYDIMRHETLVLTRAAVEKLEARARTAHHREVDHALGEQCGRLPGRCERQQAGDQGRGRGAVQPQGGEREHDRRQGKDEALEGCALPPLRCEESDRDAGRGPGSDRRDERDLSHGSQAI